jgi:hypothetical protein
MQGLEAVSPGASDAKANLQAVRTDDDLLRVCTDSGSTPTTSGRVPGMKGGGNMRYKERGRHAERYNGEEGRRAMAAGRERGHGSMKHGQYNLVSLQRGRNQAGLLLLVWGMQMSDRRK